jgi:hypothetical protein
MQNGEGDLLLVKHHFAALKENGYVVRTAQEYH